MWILLATVRSPRKYIIWIIKRDYGLIIYALFSIFLGLF